jgi:two-component system, cell cycle sensor histidine kinase and response regulator CckA
MSSFLTNLFDTSDFPARWNCGHWTALHGWTHVIADVAIFGAYAAIPLSIAYYVLRKRQEIVFPRLYWLFAAFILSCGLVHLTEAFIFWYPVYRFSGMLKVLTALASWSTVIVLVKHLPTAMALPGMAQMNDRLKEEVQNRKAAEEEVHRLNKALQDRVQELETLLKVLPVGIGITQDVTCSNIKTNAALAKMLRVEEDQNASLSASAEHMPQHFHVEHQGVRMNPDDLPIQLAARKGVTVEEFEEDVVFKDGERRHILGFAAPLLNEAGKVRGAVGAFVDITERKRAERDRELVRNRMQETQRLESLGVLAGGIAHDFNNLLTGIICNAAMVKEDVETDAEALVCLTDIEKDAQRAADLCRQLLAYAGGGRFILGPVYMSDIARDTISLLRTTYSSRAEIGFDAEPNVPPILGDPMQMRQLIMNLMMNALEAIEGENGSVKISTKKIVPDATWLAGAVSQPEVLNDEYVMFEVKDNGCGMDEPTKARMFDPFFTTKFVGRGLGLPAVLGIVRSQAGILTVSSAKDIGSTFRVFFKPAKEKYDTSFRRMKGVAGAATKTQTGTVLVVDDEETVRDVCRRALQEAGFKVLTAADGAEGLEMFREHRALIVAVVLDLTMPKMDGHQAFNAMRMIMPGVKVLLMSGFSENEVINRFSTKTPAAFIQKPYTPEMLIAKVRSIISEPGPIV